MTPRHAREQAEHLLRKAVSGPHLTEADLNDARASAFALALLIQREGLVIAASEDVVIVAEPPRGAGDLVGSILRGVGVAAEIAGAYERGRGRTR